MTTLIIATRLSQLFIRIAIGELLRDSSVIVVDTNTEVHSVLKGHNISSIHLEPAKKARFDWGERDANFKRLFMDGPQLKCDFPDTTLPVWKVVALDRFSFWYNQETKELYDMIDALSWDKCITSADLNNELPWSLARYSGKPVWGVKVSSFRTREWYDLGLTGNIPFAGLYIGNESDKAFLSKFPQVPTEIVAI